MSTLPYHHNVFSSTISKNQIRHPISVWIIIVTAMFFFLVLSIYNFFVALYNYMFNYGEDKTNNNLNILLSSLGILFLWLGLTLLVYLFLSSIGYLNEGDSSIDGHPLTKDELRTFRAIK